MDPVKDHNDMYMGGRVVDKIFNNNYDRYELHGNVIISYL